MRPPSEERLLPITRLQGLLPICRSCNRIRVPAGDAAGWVPIEACLGGRTDADFSRGIRPTRTDELLAEVDQDG